MRVCGLVMDLCAVTAILAGQLDTWDRYGPYYSPVTTVLDYDRKTSALLSACGYDNRELESAITAAEKAFEDVRRARNLAVARFKAEGVYFAVDETKRSEIEAAQLQ